MSSSPPPRTLPLFSLPTPRVAGGPSRDEQPSRGQREIRTAAPLVLIVRPSQALLERCHEAAKTLGAMVFAVDLVTLADECRARKPAAIVVTEDVHALDRRGLFELARGLGVRLVQLQDAQLPREALIAALRYALSARA